MCLSGPPASGKSSLAEVLDNTYNDTAVVGQAYAFNCFDVYSDVVLGRFYPPADPSDDAYRFVDKLRNALADVVGPDRNPAQYKQVVVLEGFPRNLADDEACMYRLASSSSPARRFPDMVISLVCGKEECKARFLAEGGEGEKFEMLWAMYQAWTVPLLASYRERGIHSVEVSTFDTFLALVYPYGLIIVTGANYIHGNRSIQTRLKGVLRGCLGR